MDCARFFDKIGYAVIITKEFTCS